MDPSTLAPCESGEWEPGGVMAARAGRTGSRSPRRRSPPQSLQPACRSRRFKCSRIAYWSR